MAARIYSSKIDQSVPLYRTYSASASDHFYTTSASERDNAVQRLGYTDEGITGYVFTKDNRGDTVPFYRAYSGGAKDHFYTVNAPEMENAVRKGGYTYEGVAAYVFEP